MSKKPKKKPEPNVVALSMVHLRKERRETQKEFAKFLGLELSKLARTEIGIIKPNVELILLLMRKLGVKADDLFSKSQNLTEDDVWRKGIRSMIERIDGERLRRIHDAVEYAVKEKEYIIKLLPIIPKDREVRSEDE